MKKDRPISPMCPAHHCWWWRAYAFWYPWSDCCFHFGSSVKKTIRPWEDCAEIHRSESYDYTSSEIPL